ncbi:acyl-CoA--6-aminopenicillanic acid acyl-transferase, partial [Pseudomonas syringae pv. tagetis]
VGVADGLQVALDEVFLWKCRGAYVHEQCLDGCTSVFCPTLAGTLIALIFVGVPQLFRHCALLHDTHESGL